MKLVLGEVASMIKPLQKYVHEDNELDIKMAKIESEIDLLKELILDTQSSVAILQKKNARKRRKAK